MRLKRRYIAISGALGATAILGLGISLPANGSEKVEGSETKGSPSGPEFKNQCEMAGGEMSRPRTGVYECSFTQDAETDWVIVCSQIEDSATQKSGRHLISRTPATTSA